MSHDRKSVLTATAEIRSGAHTKDTDDKKKTKGKPGIMPGSDPERGKKGRRRGKLKGRNHVRKPLHVKEDDANLRLTTDLPRFNWLAMKISQKGPSVTSLVKRDVKHKILATMANTQPDIKDSPAQCSVASSLAVLMETGDSCSVPAETTSTCRPEARDLLSSRWPLKKRIIRSECQTTAPGKNHPSINSPTVQQSLEKVVTPVEEDERAAVIQPIVIEIKLPPPVELIRRDSPAPPPAARTDQEQPLDLSKSSHCAFVPRTRLPRERCSVIKSTKLDLAAPLPRFPRETVMRESRRESHPRTPAVRHIEARVQHQADQVHRPEWRFHRETDQHLVPARLGRAFQVWNPVGVPESQRIVPVTNAHRESIPSDIEYLGRYQPVRVIRPKPRKPFLYPPFSWDQLFCYNCRTCGRRADFRCPGCRTSAYCSESCQRIDWPNHNLVCAVVKV